VGKRKKEVGGLSHTDKGPVRSTQRKSDIREKGYLGLLDTTGEENYFNGKKETTFTRTNVDLGSAGGGGEVMKDGGLTYS